jgi:uncharacterized protein (TIGR03437 family)
MVLLLALLLALPALAADTLPVAVAPASLSFVYQLNTDVLPLQGLMIASTETGNFTASRPIGVPWLLIGNSTSNLLGTYPQLLTVGIDPRNLGPGLYTSAIAIRSASGTVTVPVTLQVTPQQVLQATPGTAIFDSSAFPNGVTPLQSVLVLSSNPLTPVFLSASTTTPWISLRTTGSTVQVSIDRSKTPAGLAGGTFSIAANGFPTRSIPVLFLGGGLYTAPPLSVTPTALEFNGSGTQGLLVGAAAATEFTATAAVQSGAGNWLTVDPSRGTTRAGVTVCANAEGLTPGSYQGTIAFAANGATQTVPVTLTASAPAAPAITRIVNAATFQEGPLAPGEIVTLGGTGLGPACLVGLALQSDGRVATSLGGAQVLFNGIPAPLIYAAANQVSAVVPYEAAGRDSVDIRVVLSGRLSNTVPAPVVAAAPGVFTLNSSGSGPATAINIDGTTNSPSNPAQKGTAVVLYVTGEGQTNPEGVTGKVTTVSPVPPVTPEPRLSVTATLDGKPVKVAFAGQAPGFVSGVMQVNLDIPPDASPGELPLIVRVGNSASQSGVTLSVR